jgi:predicted lipoprotein with Yx(FWY)xxD motif
MEIMRQAKVVCVLYLLLLAASAYGQNMPAGIQTRKANSGKTVLADAKGMTLYTYDPDTMGKSNCNENCARAWPPLAAPENAAPMGSWTVVVRADGSKQWAYNGKPLYTWANDRQPGDTIGDGVGNVWHIAQLASDAQQSSSGAPAAGAGQQGAYGYAEEANAPGAHPSYPGLPRGAQSTKLETEIGPMKVRFYGTILFNSSIATGGVIGEEVPLWASNPGGITTFPDGTTARTGNNHDLIFTMRQSILGFTLKPAKPSDSGWNPSALFEIDFFGARTQDTFSAQNRVFNQPRVRMGYFQLVHRNLKVRVRSGQNDSRPS